MGAFLLVRALYPETFIGALRERRAALVAAEAAARPLRRVPWPRRLVQAVRALHATVQFSHAAASALPGYCPTFDMNSSYLPRGPV